MKKLKIKDFFNPTNIAAFIEGYSKFIYNAVIGLPKHQQEEIAWRMSKCEDCLKTGKCTYCGCTAAKKILVRKNCNKGERFPDLRSEKEWNEFKKTL